MPRTRVETQHDDIGPTAVDELFPQLRRVNDVFFALESSGQFDALSGALRRLVETSGRAVALITAASNDSRLRLDDRGLALETTSSAN